MMPHAPLSEELAVDGALGRAWREGLQPEELTNVGRGRLAHHLTYGARKRWSRAPESTVARPDGHVAPLAVDCTDYSACDACRARSA